MFILEPYEGKSRKTGKVYNCFKLTVGEWSTLIFPRSQFEYRYLLGVINESQSK